MERQDTQRLKLLANFQQDHQVLLHKYLNFFAQKKERCIQEVDSAFEQVRDRHSSTNLFSKQDMEKVLDDMENEMGTTFRSELEIFYRMSGVFIQMLMFDAEKQNSSIRGDVNYMENYKALQDMKDFEELVMNQDFSLTKRATIKAQLPALGTPVTVQKVIVADEKVEKRNKELESEMKRLKTQLSEIGDADSPQIAEMATQLNEMKSELNKKINQTAAVTNMKKMIQDKNQIIKDLREKLAKYEGDEQ